MIDSSKAGREQTTQVASDSSKRAKVESSGGFGVELESQARNFDRWETYRGRLLSDWDGRTQEIDESDGSDLKNQIRKMPYLNRNVLYKADFEDGPHLVDCVRNLDRWTPDSTLGKANNVWIFNKKPCVDTSTYDLTALSFMLGMRLKQTPGSSTIIGKGAYGISMTCQKQDAYGQLHFAYSGDFEDMLEKPMGSGYSMLFAKHHACGALPLGLDSPDSKRRLTMVIDRGILENIIEVGEPIDYTWAPVPETGAITSLHRMPSSRYVYLLQPEAFVSNENNRNRLGVITWGDESAHRLWWQAVAGIAFGGLVPQSTWSLVAAVRFTTLGGLKWDKDCLISIQHLVGVVHDRAVERNDHSGEKKRLRERLHLFGRYRARATVSSRHKESVIKPNSCVESRGLDTRTAARVFSWYMTLLECVTAQYLHQAAEEEKKTPTDSAEEIFQECSKQLEVAYKNAVDTKNPDIDWYYPDREATIEGAGSGVPDELIDSAPSDPLLGDSEKLRELEQSRYEIFESKGQPSLVLTSQLVVPEKASSEHEIIEFQNDLKPADNGKGFNTLKEDPAHQTNESQKQPSSIPDDDVLVVESEDSGPKKIDSPKEPQLTLEEDDPAISKRPLGGKPPICIKRKSKDSAPSISQGNDLRSMIDGLVHELGDWDDESDKYSIPFPFTRERCGKIARIIIAAWAHQVQIISWDENEFDDRKKEELNLNPYLMLKPETFPDVSALGGI